ncbi:restriction endonuclease subunit S domain-containing protein [Thermococcus henrietii]|uniref:hypothetical protein n=1 Tax=Thermococcus henrietii TaxID=2016361 RepID=UPI000C06A78C|nr:hypothetical protein [Thermococcus henrietii]
MKEDALEFQLLSDSPLIFLIEWDTLRELGRIDVKHAELVIRKKQLDDLKKDWEELGFEILPLGHVIRNVNNVVKTSTIQGKEGIPLLSITFEGKAIRRSEKLHKKSRMSPITTKYPTLLKVSAWDVVLSRIDIVNGAVAIIPEDLNDHYVTKEFMVLRPKKKIIEDKQLIELIENEYPDVNLQIDSKMVTSWYLWIYLRSNFVRSYVKGLMKGVTGRHRVKWEQLKHLPVPVPESASLRQEIAKEVCGVIIKDYTIQKLIKEKENDIANIQSTLKVK